jgi:hypothetical protein
VHSRHMWNRRRLWKESRCSLRIQVNRLMTFNKHNDDMRPCTRPCNRRPWWACKVHTIQDTKQTSYGLGCKCFLLFKRPDGEGTLRRCK